MTVSEQASVIALGGRRPRIAPDAFVAAGARLVGEVELSASASVWYNAVLRADLERIVIGRGSNVQDGVAIHTDIGAPTIIADDVSIGHNAVIHGATVGEGTLIGMGAVVLNGAVIGEESLIAGGAVVLEGADIPAGSLVAGVPAVVRRPLAMAELAGIRANAEDYRRLLRLHDGAGWAS